MKIKFQKDRVKEYIRLAGMTSLYSLSKIKMELVKPLSIKCKETSRAEILLALWGHQGLEKRH
jgi:hypothetical protein